MNLIYRIAHITEKSFILILLVIIVILDLSGLLIYNNSFIPNFLAEISGIFTGIVISLVLINRFNKSQKRKRWEKIESSTYDSLIIFLEEFLLQVPFNIFYSDLSPMISDWKNIKTESIEKLRDWIKDLEFNKHKIQNKILNPQGESISKFICDWYNATEDSLYMIRTVLFPRILEFSEDEILLNSLNDFDMEMMELYIVKKGFENAYDLFPYFINSLNKIQQILIIIEKRKTNLTKK